VREFVKSFFSLSLAASLFPLKQLENMLTPTERGEHKGPATKAMDSLVNATVDHFGGTLKGTFSALDNVQRGVVSLGFGMLWPSSGGGRSQRDDAARQTDRVHTRPAAETSARTEPSDIDSHRRRANGQALSGRRA
jgi:hypothetical protein